MMIILKLKNVGYSIFMESLSFNGFKCKLLNYILNGNYNTITFIYIIMLYSNFLFSRQNMLSLHSIFILV